MTRSRPALALAAVALITCTGPTSAQPSDSGPCFEVIAPRPNSQPRSPVLLDRCSGRTWLLVRNADGIYRWRPIATDNAEVAFKAPSRPQAQAPEIPKAAGGKCFTFDGRKFCE